MNASTCTADRDQAGSSTAPTITTCCIVGGGPAGAVLALLLARKGVPVVLLESHTDFDRDFRGDTIHPSVMELMTELGLADRLLQLRHTKIRSFSLPTTSGSLKIAPFGRLKTRYPYITLMPQAAFLQFITAEAQRYPNFQLKMGARVEQLIEEDGVVRGVHYHDATGEHSVRALLTVGADGRFSKMRKLGGFQAVKTSPPMDVLWFRLPRHADEPEELQAYVGGGRIMAMLNRYDTWQIAYVIIKGSFHRLREAGLDHLRRSIVELAPHLADRVDTLQHWQQLSLLSVESDRVTRWYKPGLLLIGDAAHTMSPVGGVGINYAIQDAIVAANVLTQPLQHGRYRLSHLRSIQRQREWPIRLIQAGQALIQQQVVRRALDPQNTIRGLPVLRTLARIPGLRTLPGRVLAYGVWPVHVRA